VIREGDIQSWIGASSGLTTMLEWVDALGLPPGSRILEAGCGAGLTTISLAQRGFMVEAQDVANAMVEQTRRHAEEAGLHPPTVDGSRRSTYWLHGRTIRRHGAEARSWIDANKLRSSIV